MVLVLLSMPVITTNTALCEPSHKQHLRLNNTLPEATATLTLCTRRTYAVPLMHILLVSSTSSKQ
jgi:hypothetical protein